MEVRTVRRIRPGPRQAMPDFRELWRFRDLGRMFVLRDMRLRYRQTLVGVAWVFLQPLVGAGAFTLVFGVVARLSSQGVPYFVFSLTGMTAWLLFASTLSRASQSILANSQLVSKSYFPRLWLPLSSVGAVVADFGVSLAMVAVLLLIYRRPPGLALLLLPVWVVGLVLLALGPGVWSAAVSASYRDVQYTTPLLVQTLLYVSPVAYAATSVPHGAAPFFAINPLTGLLDGFRWSVLGTAPPSANRIVWSLLACIMSASMGLAMFARAERRFADVI